MRLTRGTIILIVALLVVFIGALLVSNQQAAAPGTPTATLNPESGELFTTIDNGGLIARYELRDATSGSFVELNRLDAQNWSIVGTGAVDGSTPESSLIETTASQLVDIQYTTSFQSDDLASFGLTNPQYAIYLQTGTGEAYTLYIGAKTPTNPRYYAILEPGIAEPAPIAESTVEATGEATSEATVEATEAALAADATAESTVEADDATDVVVPTRDPLATDVFANLLNPTPLPTPSLRPSTFTLSGTKTIYIIPQTVLNTLTSWLVTPPYAPPATATLAPTPTFELMPDSTAEVTPEATTEATSEATVEATLEAEATAEATAES